jgi:hypothetical protein
MHDHGAEPLVRRSLELRTAALGPDHADTMRSALHLAELLDSTDRQSEAEAMYRNVLRACRAAFGERDARTLRVERMLAHNLAYLQRRVPEAIALIEASSSDADQPTTLEHRAYLPQLLALHGDWERGQQIAHSCVAALTQAAGPDDIRTGAALDALAVVLVLGPGRGDEAVDAALAAQRVRARWFGEQSLQWAQSRSLAAQALDKAGRAREAAAAWDQTAAVYERLLGETDFETLRARGEQARALLNAGEDLDRAQSLALAAGLAMDKIFASLSGYGYGYRTVAAQAAQKAGNPERALEIFDSLIADLRAHDAPDRNRRQASTLRRSAGVLREAGQEQAAQARETEAATLEQQSH